MHKLAIIPARGGSKRIPRKNVKDFRGMPVIAYSILAALRSGCFDRVMVSTDDPEIAEVARRYGAEVPFMRSASTANDYATTADVIREVLREYAERGEEFDIFACIYATAPFITPRRLREGMKLIESGRAQAAFTCVEYSYPIQRSLRIGEEGKIAMRYPEYAAARSQDLEKTYHDAGQFYLSTVKAFEQCGSLWGPDTLPIILSELEVQDLDTPTDWRLAEMKFALTRLPDRFEAGGYTFTSYTLLDRDIHLKVLEERNEPALRELMVNTGEIPEVDHFRFVESLKTDRDRQYYLVSDSSGMVASVNVEWLDNGVVERGIWVARNARGKGHAKRLLRALYDYLRDNFGVSEVVSCVKPVNAASLALEHSLGAVETGADSQFKHFCLKLRN